MRLTMYVPYSKYYGNCHLLTKAKFIIICHQMMFKAIDNWKLGMELGITQKQSVNIMTFHEDVTPSDM